MKKIIVSEFLTLDGVMEAPEGWQLPYFSDDVAEVVKAQILATDTLLLGRVTYETYRHQGVQFGRRSSFLPA